MKGFTRILLLAVMSLLLASAFGAAAAQDDEITLDLWMFLDGTGFLPSVVEAFEAAHPNIKVRITDVPEGEVRDQDRHGIAGRGAAGYRLPLFAPLDQGGHGRAD